MSSGEFAGWITMSSGRDEGLRAPAACESHWICLKNMLRTGVGRWLIYHLCSCFKFTVGLATVHCRWLMGYSDQKNLYSCFTHIYYGEPKIIILSSWFGFCGVSCLHHSWCKKWLHKTRHVRCNFIFWTQTVIERPNFREPSFLGTIHAELEFLCLKCSFIPKF